MYRNIAVFLAFIFVSPVSESADLNKLFINFCESENFHLYRFRSQEWGASIAINIDEIVIEVRTHRDHTSAINAIIDLHRLMKKHRAQLPEKCTNHKGE